MSHQTLTVRKLQNQAYRAVLATEYPVDRRFGTEILEINRSSINFERFPLPVILSHKQDTLPVGVATNPRIEGKQLVADIYLGESESAKSAARDITDGLLTSVSIGYRNNDYFEIEGGVRVTDWTPHEVSLVSVPADPHAKIGKRKMTTSTGRRETSEIMNLAHRHNLVPEGIRAIENGTTIDDFRGEVLERIGSQSAVAGGPFVGLTDSETDAFSLSRAIMAQASGDWSDAGFEREVLRSTSRHSTRANGFVLPAEFMQRDILKSGTGSNLVGTEHMSDRFIDFLYKRSDILPRVTSMQGMTQDIAIPKMTGTASVAYYAEGAAVTESTPTFSQVTLSANTLGALVEFSRKMMTQGLPNIEALVRRDLARVIGIKLDEVILNGSGSGAEPTGILGTSGIGAVSLGANGAAPTFIDLVDLIKAVAIDDADENGVFIINPQTEAFLRRTPKVSSTDSVMILEGDRMANRPVVVASTVPSNLTKGTGTDLSAIIYGNLSDVVYATFGGLEITVDPYTKLDTGVIRVGAYLENDIAVRHPESFSAILDADV